jgi:hypothetical protein
MSVDWRCCAGAATGALALLLNAALGTSTVRAQGPPAPTPAQAPAAAALPAGYSTLAPALQATLQTGRPTVVVVTSGGVPASAALRDALPGLLRTQPVGAVALLAEMPAEQHADRIRALGVSHLPAVLVYGRNEAGMQLVAHRLGVTDPYQVTGWLASLGLERAAIADATPPVDPTVQRTGAGSLPTGQYPSGQAPPPPPSWPTAPPPQAPPAPPQMYVQQVPVTPTYAAPSPTPLVVAPPTQPVVVAPPAQTIMVAPAPPPNIIFSAPTQPTVMMAPVGSAPVGSAPTNAFLAPSQPAMAPVAMAPAPVAMAPSAPVAMAPVGQAPQVGQGPVTAAFMTLVAPTLFERLLGAIGQRLAEKGQPRLSVGQAPTMSTMAMAPTAFGAAPQAMMAPQVPPGYRLVPAYPYEPAPPGYAPPPNYGYGPPAEGYPPPNAPSPQSYRQARAPGKHGW